MLFNFFQKQEDLLNTRPSIYFQRAVSNGESRNARKALMKGVKINMRDKFGTTATMYAIITGQTRLLNTLLEFYPDLHLKNNKGLNALFVAIEAKFPQYILPLVHTDPSILNDYCRDMPPLYYAAAQNDMTAVRTLLLMKAPINASEKTTGQTPLMIAALNNNERMVRLLVRAGADLSARDANGHSVLDLMIQQQNQSMVDYLESQLVLRETALNVDEIVNGGFTPLTWAASNEKTAVVQTLIQAGAEIARADGNGKTALDIAFQKNNRPLIHILKKAYRREKNLVKHIQKRIKAGKTDLWKGVKTTSCRERQKILKMISFQKER